MNTFGTTFYNGSSDTFGNTFGAQSSTPDEDDVISIDGKQYVKITVFVPRGSYSREVYEQNVSLFDLSKYNGRFDDRKYYRRNRSD